MIRRCDRSTVRDRAKVGRRGVRRDQEIQYSACFQHVGSLYCSGDRFRPGFGIYDSGIARCALLPFVGIFWSLVSLPFAGVNTGCRPIVFSGLSGSRLQECRKALCLRLLFIFVLPQLPDACGDLRFGGVAGVRS